MSLSAKNFKTINAIVESKYSLSLNSKGNCGYEPFIYSGEDSGHVFLKIEDILTIGKDSKDNFKVYSESISSFFNICEFEEEKYIFLQISNSFSDLAKFLGKYFERSDFNFQEFNINLYQGSIKNIDNSFQKNISFWFSFNFSKKNKFTKICHFKIVGNDLFLNFEKITIEDSFLKTNQLTLSEASKQVKNMNKLKIKHDEIEECRELFNKGFLLKEMIEY